MFVMREGVFPLFGTTTTIGFCGEITLQRARVTAVGHRAFVGSPPERWCLGMSRSRLGLSRSCLGGVLAMCAGYVFVVFLLCFSCFGGVSALLWQWFADISGVALMLWLCLGLNLVRV